MASNASLDGVISHWCTLIENLQASPLQFYESVETALKRREVPETKNSRVDYKESGVLSSKREYLHVAREKLVFDICGAPFGTGFFVSWWLAEEKQKLNPLFKILAVIVSVGLVAWTLNQLGLFWGTMAICLVVPGVLALINNMATEGTLNDDFIRVLPIIGPLYEWLFKSATYYRIDTTLMFQKAVHNAVLEVIDEMTTAKGLRSLGEGDRKPVMREFYQRKAA
jgi:hypothetical protein